MNEWLKGIIVGFALIGLYNVIFDIIKLIVISYENKKDYTRQIESNQFHIDCIRKDVTRINKERNIEFLRMRRKKCQKKK